MRKIIFILFVSQFSLYYSQTVEKITLSSNGANYSNASLQLSFTFGETFTSYYNQPTFNVSLGFQDQFSQVTTAIFETNNDYDLKIYPNPTSNYIKIENENTSILKISLYNALGQLLFESNQYVSIINMLPYIQGAYYLTITTKQKTITQKIIKI